MDHSLSQDRTRQLLVKSQITITIPKKNSCDNFFSLFFKVNKTGLSKAFDCLSHELLIAKVDAYGFDKNALKLVNSYLTYRKQRVKINDKYSSWSEILFRVPQGSILGPLLFNVFICDMFCCLEDSNIANYADNSTPCKVDKNNNLEQSSSILFKWLNDNCMKVNTDKSHLLVSRNVRATPKMDNNYIESEKD